MTADSPGAKRRDPARDKPRRSGLTRRGLTIGGIALIGATAVPALARTRENHVRSILIANFGEAMLEGADADRFIADAARVIDQPASWMMRVRTWGVIKLGDLAPFNGTRRGIEEMVLTLFLKRTNAWRCWVGRDEQLVYVSLDPYETGCGNFLAAAYDPGA